MQHTAVVKALEAVRKAGEAPRGDEEGEVGRAKKMEERRRKLESWRDQRSPTEDMSLTDHKTLPRHSSHAYWPSR